jgi:hypothetical protein
MMADTDLDLVRATQLQLYITRVKNSGNIVLQYNRNTGRLRMWKW